MRKYNRILRWTNLAFYLLAFVTLGGYGVLSYLERGGAAVRDLRKSPMYWVITAFFGLLFLLQCFARDKGIPRVRSRDYLRVHNDDGEIAVSLRAVEDSLTRAVRALPDILEVEVRIQVPEPKRKSERRAAVSADGAAVESVPPPEDVSAEQVEGSKAAYAPTGPGTEAMPAPRLVEEVGLVVRAHYATYDGISITDMHDKVQQLLKARFQEIVAVENLPPFQVVLTDIVPKQESRREARKRKKEAALEEPMFTGPKYL